MVRKQLAAILAASVLLFSFSGCQSKRSPTISDSLTVLTIGTADSGGTMYPVGAAIANVLSDDSLKVNVGASTGSAMNIQNLADGVVDLALVSGDAAYEAYHSSESESGLRAVAAVYTSVSNWLAPKSENAYYVHDLKGLRIGVGPENSTTELAARVVIETIGLDQSNTIQVNCGLGAGTEMVLNGELDAIHGFSGIPIGGLATLAEKVPCRVLRYTPEELDAILASNAIYSSGTIPAHTYKEQPQDIKTFGVKCLLCVDASMDEELVSAITKMLWDNRESLSQAHPSMSVMEEDTYLFDNLPIPLHTGAEKFYAEVG